MKIINKKVTLLSIMLATYLTGCSSGNSTKQVYIPPQGPVSYKGIQQLFAQPNLKQQTLQVTGSSGCGSVMNGVGEGLGIATGFVSFIPVAGPAISAIVGAGSAVANAMGASKGNNCIVQQQDLMQAQLNIQAQQISQLDTALQLSDNQIYKDLTSDSTTNLGNAYDNYNKAIQTLIGGSSGSGYVYNALTSSGFWNQNGESNPAMTQNMLLANQVIPGSPTNAYSYYGLWSYLNNASEQNPNILYYVANVSGTNLQVHNSKTVIRDAGTQYITLINALYRGLNSLLSSSASTPTTNLVPFIDEYNNVLMYLYLKSLYAIQQSYTMLYYINLTNYQNYITNGASTACSFYSGNETGIPAGCALPSLVDKETNIYYSPIPYTTESQELAAYNNAQESLTMMYAQVVNQLYQNTLNFIVTDNPLSATIATSPQSYPNNTPLVYYDQVNGSIQQTGEIINYTSSVGKYSSTATAALENAMVSANPLTGQNLVNSLQAASNILFALYYQYSGLNNVGACESALVQYNETNGTNGSILDFYQQNPSACASILATSSGSPVESSIMSGNTIQPYYAAPNGYPALMGSVTNNVNPQTCNSQAVGVEQPPYSLYNYIPTGQNPTLGQIGLPYLMCGNWSTAGMPGSNGASPFVVTPPDLATQYLGTTLYLVGNFSSSWEQGLTFVFTNTAYNEQQLTANDYGVIDNGNYPQTGGNIVVTALSSSTNWGYQGNNGNIILGNGYNSIYTGWMNQNAASYSQGTGTGISAIAAIQVNLADGFVVPLGLVFTNLTNWAGNYAGISVNPNIANVLIDGQPLLNTNGVIFNANSWGEAVNSTYPINNGGKTLYSTQFTVNNNVFILNGSSNTTPFGNGGYGFPHGTAYIVTNPGFCPSRSPVQPDWSIQNTSDELWNFMCTF